MPIITVPEGSFTPGAEFAMGTIASVINAAWEQANNKQSSFETKVANATSSWLDTETPPFMAAANVAAITVDEPAVSIPATADKADVLDTFDTKYLELVALLSDKFALFRSTYFPDEQVAYTAAEDWLQGAVANPSQGLPSAVAAQVLTDDKDRILSDSVRAQDEVLATFAAKRFPLPPGAAASAVLQIQQSAMDKVAESSRKVAIASIEQMRFAVQNLMSLRQNAMGSAVSYIQALASGPDMASRVVGIGYDAQSKLISSAASFYNARTEAKKLTASINQANASFEQDAGKENLKSELTLIEDRLKAMLTEAQSLAQMATALYNNVHAGANTGYTVNGT